MKNKLKKLITNIIIKVIKDCWENKKWYNI